MAERPARQRIAQLSEVLNLCDGVSHERITNSPVGHHTLAVDVQSAQRIRRGRLRPHRAAAHPRVLRTPHEPARLPLRATCELHRAEVLCAMASLEQGLSAVSNALAKLPTSEPWSLGDEYGVRGDIRAAIGDFEAARDDYPSAYATGWDAEPGNAVLLAEDGNVDGALSALERVLASLSWFGLQRRGWILAHKARICALAGRADAAHSCIAELSSTFDGWPSSAIHALVTEAQAYMAAKRASGRAT